jgi:hypothetical protein
MGVEGSITPRTPVQSGDQHHPRCRVRLGSSRPPARGRWSRDRRLLHAHQSRLLAPLDARGQGRGGRGAACGRDGGVVERALGPSAPGADDVVSDAPTVDQDVVAGPRPEPTMVSSPPPTSTSTPVAVAPVPPTSPPPTRPAPITLVPTNRPPAGSIVAARPDPLHLEPDVGTTGTNPRTGDTWLRGLRALGHKGRRQQPAAADLRWRR